VSDRTYKKVEIVGTSPDGVDQAIRNGLARAARTLRNLDWFEVADNRRQVVDTAPAQKKVTMKDEIRLDDDDY
jgi:flavin-binding protein dodecin